MTSIAPSAITDKTRVSKFNAPLKIQNNSPSLSPSYATANIMSFATIRSCFAIGSMSIQTLRVNNHQLKLPIFKNVYATTLGTQILLNTAMASTGIGIYALGENHVKNKEFYKISAITFAQLCLMQPIYNNIINGVQKQLINKQTKYSFFPSIKIVPFIMFREFISIGCGFACAEKFKHWLVEKNYMNPLNAGILAGCAVGLVSATITQPAHNSVTYHVSKQQEGCKNSIFKNTTHFFKTQKSGVLTKGLLARYLMVMPTIASMNTFLAPLYDSLTTHKPYR